MHHIVLRAICIAAPVLILSSAQAQVPPDPGGPGPYTTAFITVTTTNPNTGSQLVTDIHYPSNNGVVDPSGAPYPTIVFAHGWMASKSTYVGFGRHLATWGYIVAIPSFPDDHLEVRASDVQYLLSYLISENANSSSRFFHKIDTNRLGIAGHSLGGATTMMVASRDARIKAAVALDPVNPPSSLGVGTWDYQTEAPEITAPLGVLGAPSQTCNTNANYNTTYPVVGATHKAKYVVANASHCDFMDPDNSLELIGCALFCGIQASANRQTLIEGYTTAWFNYYLDSDPTYYSNIYGAQSNADLQADRISSRDVQTAPRGVAANAGTGEVDLNWNLYFPPIIAGYNIYRSQLSEVYGSTPYAQVSRVTSFFDTGAAPGAPYFYVLRSRDAAGNEHQTSAEVSAAAREPSVTYWIYVPLVVK